MTLLVYFNEFMRCSFACAIKRLQWLVVSFAIFKKKYKINNLKLVLCRRTSDFWKVQTDMLKEKFGDLFNICMKC